MIGIGIAAIAAASLGTGLPLQGQDGIKRLEFLLGEWTSEEVAYPPGRDPVHFTLQGKNEWTLGETFLRIEESFEIPGAGKRFNLILMSYDAAQKAYVAWWFSNSSPRPFAFSGGFEGAKLVFLSVTDPSRPGPSFRITYDPKSATEMDALLEVKSGEEFVRRTEAKYKKKG